MLKQDQKSKEKLILRTYGDRTLAEKPSFQGSDVNLRYWKNINGEISSQKRVPSREKLILETYGDNTLAKKPAFQGGYINFGYWKDININSKISSRKRIQASESLYQLLINHLSITKNDRILEVGCGLGNAGTYIAKTFNPAYMLCVDVSDMQIKRARKIHHECISRSPNLIFAVGKDDSIDAPDQSFNKIFSLEAAQYFASITSFAKEMYRLLVPGGEIAVSTFFSTSELGYKKASRMLPTVQSCVDLIIPINEFRNKFVEAGLKEVHFEKIGKYVFQGFDKWLSQVEDVAWGRNFYKLYLDQAIDYYSLVFTK